MMNGDDTFEFKQKISNGFADSILASSPTKNGTMNAISLSDGCDLGDGEQDHLMHDISTKEKSGFSESGSPSPSPDSCSPCPNGEDQDQADRYNKENNHHVNLDPVWPNGPAAVQQFSNQGGRKDGDSGFISPEGATNGPTALEGRSLMDGTTLHSDLQRQSSDGLMEFEANRTPSLDVEIDSKPLDLSLDSDVDGLASSLQDKDEDFEIIEDLKETNQYDLMDESVNENKTHMNMIIESNTDLDKPSEQKINVDFIQTDANNESKSNDDDGLCLEQDEILEDELIKTKLELKVSTDTEKEKEVSTDDYEYSLQQDDGCQADDPMTTSMIQPIDPMTSSMINFDTQSIDHDQKEQGEILSLKSNDDNLIKTTDEGDKNKEEKELKSSHSSSSSEDEEDHTEKKDKEKEHESSSSSSEDEREKEEKNEKNYEEKRHSSSSSSSEDEADKENDNDMQELIERKHNDMVDLNNVNDSRNINKSIAQNVDNDSDAQSSSSEEANDNDVDDKDMTSEKDMVPYDTIQKNDEAYSSEDENEKDLSDEKDNISVLATENQIEHTPQKDQPLLDSKNIVGNELKSEEIDYSIQSLPNDKCFEKTEDADGGNDSIEIIPDNASSCLGDVCSIPDMHNDEVKMNVEQDVFAADKSADNVHSEDEREDCPILNAESRNGSRKNTLSSVSSDEANEDEGYDKNKNAIDLDSISLKVEESEHGRQLSGDELIPKIDNQQESNSCLEQKESILCDYVSQNADLSTEQEENGICYEPQVDTVTQNDVAMEMTSSRNDNEESEDVIMKESMVTNVSEGKPSDIGFELNENMEHETKPDSPTLQTAFFENKEIANESVDAFSGQTSSKIESNEYCYQKNEDTSLDLASLDSQVPAGQFSSVEEVENAAVSPVDENLMEDNMSNIKETEFLVETSTNLASSQEPSGIFSQNDEHMAQKVSEFGVNGEYENSNDFQEGSNCLEDNATKDAYLEKPESKENVLTLADNDMCLNQPKEIYENTSFELNSVEKDAVFDGNTNAKLEETLSSVPQQQTDINVLDSESESAKIEVQTELETAKAINKSNFDNELKNEEIKEEDMNESKCPEEKIEQQEMNSSDIVAKNEVETSVEKGIQESEKTELIKHEYETEVTKSPVANTDSERHANESGFGEELKTTTLQSDNEQTNNTDINQGMASESELERTEFIESNKSEQENTQIVERADTDEIAVTKSASGNEKETVVETGPEIDLQTGIQESEPTIEIETTKETNAETHLTSQELNANTAQQNIETTENFNQDTADTKVDSNILPVTVDVPVKEVKKEEEVSESKSKPASEKKTPSKPAPKTTNGTKTSGSASKLSKPGASNSSLKKSEATKSAVKPSPRPAAPTPKTTVAKTGAAGGQSSAPRRSVPPAKPNTTAPKTTAKSAPSANTSKPGTTSKPQTNGASRPTSATTRPTARPTSARPTTTTTTKTPSSRPQTAKPTSATSKTPSSTRPTTAGTTRAPISSRTPLSTKTTPATKPSPIPSTLKPRPTSTSRLRAASATRKAQASPANITTKTAKPTPARTPLSRPSPKPATSSLASTKTQSKPAPSNSRSTPSKPTPPRSTPASKRPTPATKTPTKPGTKGPVSKGSTKPVAIKKPSTENAENEVNDLGKSEVSVEENVLIQHDENKVNGLPNGVHPITNGVNGVHSDDEGQSLELNGCNSALDCVDPVQ